MFRLSEDDDDTFFSPVASSKLASLFGETMSTAEMNANTSLTYTAPKQPQVVKTQSLKKNSDQATTQTSSLIIAKVVHTYKLENDNYVSLGKLGLALVGIVATRQYQLILYKVKTEHIVNVKLTEQFELTIQRDNYITFYDDKRQCWSILFENESDFDEFFKKFKECNISKIIRLNSPESAPNTKPVVGTKPYDTKTNLAKDYNQSIKKDLFNKDEVQSDSTGTNAKSDILSRMAKMGQPILLPNRSESTVTSDVTDSETESDCRNQKMPKKIPKKLVSTVQSSTVINSTNTQPSTNNLVQSPVQQYALINGQFVPVAPTVIQPITVPKTLPLAQPIEPVTQTQLTNSHYTPQHQLITYDSLSQHLVTPVNAMPSDNLNMYFTENRMHNSEVRMHMLKMTDKVEKILEKIDNLQINNSNANTGLKLERNDQLKKQIEDLTNQSTLLKNENVDLKQQINNLQIKQESKETIKIPDNCKNGKCQELILELSEINKQNEAQISELLESVKVKEIENSTMLEKNKENEEKILELLKKIKHFEDNFINKEELNQQKSCTDELKSEQNHYLKKIHELEEENKNLHQSCSKQIEDYKRQISDSEIKLKILDEINQSNEDYQRQISDLNNQLERFKKQFENQELGNKKCIDTEKIENEIKFVMNVLYNQLTEKENAISDARSSIIQATFAIISKLDVLKQSDLENVSGPSGSNVPPPVPQFDAKLDND